MGSKTYGEEQARSVCRAAAGAERAMTEQWDIFPFALLSIGVQKDLCSPCCDKL